MIAINKREKEIISQELPKVRIIRTVKNKTKRHRYLCEGSPRVLKLLARLRGDTKC